VSIFVFLGAFNVAFAQITQYPDSVFIESRSDSLDLANNFYDLFDSLSQKLYPAEELYLNWNTHSIFYRAGDSIKKTDSVKLVLVNLFMNELYAQPAPGIVTSGFGYRKSRFHYGTDIDVETGDPIKAAFDGKVRITIYDRGYGNVIVIRHLNGLETVYAHLSKILVDTNSTIKAGDIIGYGGNTGRSYGSHLHFEIRYLGAAINSETLIDYKNQKLIADTVWLTKKNFEYLHKIEAVKAAKYHVVRSGDTLGAIAKKYGTTVSKLCNLNGIRENKLLQIGQKIRVK
jgi:murein DD-endopeptidase MepM/ murein hydrolase activator NlpD